MYIWALYVSVDLFGKRNKGFLYVINNRIQFVKKQFNEFQD